MITLKILLTSIDSLQVEIIKHSIDNLSTQIAKVNSETDNSSLYTFLSGIFGGLLVIAGQYAVEKFKTKDSKTTELSNILSEIVRQRNIIRNLYRELALYKMHAAYWWFCTTHTADPVKSEMNRQDHLRSQAEARKISREIGEANATFFGLVTKFEVILKKMVDVSKNLENINNFKTRHVEEYDTSLDYDYVKKQVNIDEENLRNEYFENLKEFDSIILSLKEQIK